jgi:hypothetical protein
VWSDEASLALGRLQPNQTESISVVGAPPRKAATPSPTDIKRVREECGIAEWTGPVICVFSQTHGSEFAAATHYDLAGQLHRTLERAPSAFLLIKRHPSERASVYESLVDGHPRCAVAPVNLSSSQVASVSDVAVALGSTALIDAARVGCIAVEVSSSESLMEQPVSSTRVRASELAGVLVPLVTDSAHRATRAQQQTQQLEQFVGPADFDARVLDALASVKSGGDHASA